MATENDQAATVAALATDIRRHNGLYFVKHAPEISDAAFDLLVERLRALAPDHPVLSGLIEDVSDEAGLLEHRYSMLSLDKAYDEAGVLKWAASFDGPVVEAPKIDGIAASLRYDAAGTLVAAVTRGDGRHGELFTANARFIRGIPQRISAGPAEIRGEVYLPLGVFRERFAGQFANPRNTAAGAIKQKVAAKTADYALAFYAYSLKETPPEVRVETVSDGLAWVAAQGFEPVPWRLTERGDIEAGYQTWRERRPTLDVELDGVVYTADRFAEHARLGETAHHPRWAIAYKFQGESGETRIREIFWSVSRSGAITPIAHVEPITLSGASVSRCSLHNLAILRNLGANVGARVIATRRGGVIPHIEAVLERGPDEVELPERCPVSGHLARVDGDVLMCSEPDACGAAQLGTLGHFLRAVGIEGFGPKILSQLRERGMVAQPADFFSLDVARLSELERLGRKSAENLVAQVQAHRVIGLANFLEALGVDDLGAVASRKVAEAFGTLEAVRSASREAIAAIHGLGELTAEAIARGLEARRELIDRLYEIVTVTPWVDEAPRVARPEGDPVAGRSFVFTGKLASSDRKTAQGLVIARGGLTPEDVTRTLDYLVVGDDGSPLLGGGALSSKHKKAEKLIAEGASQLRIITERDFHALLAAPPTPPEE
jgi:DNA ligase (NAD+)